VSPPSSLELSTLLSWKAVDIDYLDEGVIIGDTSFDVERGDIECSMSNCCNSKNFSIYLGMFLTKSNSNIYCYIVV
jgi:hypothetical protein